MATSSSNQYDQSSSWVPAPSSSQHDQDNVFPPDKDPKYYLPLYKAAIEGDWKKATDFFTFDPGATVARITNGLNTALQIAAMSGNILFSEELIKLMPIDSLALQNEIGLTALHFAAMSGKTKIAKAMLRKNHYLPLIRDFSGDAPVIRAARLGHKDMVSYLCSVTSDEDPNSPIRGLEGVQLLISLIAADFYDVALQLVQRCPELTTTIDNYGQSALLVLARRSSAFKSGSRMGFWQRCIYSCIPAEQASTADHHRNGDMENPSLSSRDCTLVSQIVQVSSMKQVYDNKVMHTQALELVKFVCAQVSLLGTQLQMDSLLSAPILVAGEYGNVEVLAVCTETCPSGFTSKYSESLENLAHIAVKYRQENIFNHLRRTGTHITMMAGVFDVELNTILHHAAKLGPPSKLNVVSGAALQMQRELQWFQEVEKIVQPTYREFENRNGERPRPLFAEEHRDLIEKGEKWMKDMASSSMVVATLIATVVFTAAFTVPGGNKSESSTSEVGTPIFLKEKWFMVFAISNALALFSSLTSVLIFLSILTSRYAQEDFLKSLPQKLIMGLATLFFSIAAMMVTFSATYFIMLGHQLASIALLVALFACVPVTLFAWLQFPLFVEVISSTYGSDVFNR